ncbi:hypothetical protein EJB05_39152, partial [Eragrostis curvula]
MLFCPRPAALAPTVTPSRRSHIQAAASRFNDGHGSWGGRHVEWSRRGSTLLSGRGDPNACGSEGILDWAGVGLMRHRVVPPSGLNGRMTHDPLNSEQFEEEVVEEAFTSDSMFVLSAALDESAASWRSSRCNLWTQVQAGFWLSGPSRRRASLQN